MAGETILLFSTHLDQSLDNKEKVIKVKSPESFHRREYKNDQQSKALKDIDASIQMEIKRSKSQLDKLKEQRKQLLNATKEEITLARKKWEQEKKSYIEQATEEGYNAGFELGKKNSMEKYEQLIEHGNELTESAIVGYHSMVEKSEQKIIDIAIHTAEKIIKQEVNKEPEIFLSIVKEAIKETKSQSTISIYLHPKNYTNILKQKKELANVLDGETKVLIFIDQEIEEDGCMINHAFGQIDASIHTQLDQIHHVLNEIYTESINHG